MSRYVVGIDLGTTNSALAYADTREATLDAPAPTRTLAIPQVVGVNDVGERPVLPSFLYLCAAKEFPAGATDLPWKSPAERVVGTFAREHGAKVPGRLISSAKSWLSHTGVDRHAALLPWTAAEGVERVSPVAASSAYLAHLRDAWNHLIAGKATADRLEHQDVLLTVPASFDAAARELTVEAARAAGLEQVTLLEEPQAAFYSWLAVQGDQWRKKVKVGDILLVCDVGGGTTDFTLIAVSDEDGDLALTRLAVGEHILLGGDNMDLALAHAVAATLPNGMEGLDATQRVALGHACRNAKETLFTSAQKATVPVAVLGRGSKVIGGAIKAELTRETLHRVLIEGFLPRCAATDQPERGRRIGLTEIGLPYAADPAITRHLARFLSQQAGSLHSGDLQVKPSAVLFNGGVFIKELNRVAGKPGLRALHLPNSIAGRDYLFEPQYEPLLARCEELGYPLLFHPLVGNENIYGGPERIGNPLARSANLHNTLGNNFESATTAAKFIVTGALDKFPKLEIVLPHSGGCFPYITGRVERGFTAQNFKLQRPFKEYVRRFHYDTLTYNPDILRFLITMVGSDRVVIGTDNYALMDVQQPNALVEQLNLPAEDSRRIFRGNAEKLFRL